MSNIQFLNHRPASQSQLAGQYPANWHAVLSHTHVYRGSAEDDALAKPPASYEHLAAWTKRLGIAALGMGSPYTPDTARLQSCYDGDNRAQYYSGKFDQHSVRGDEEIAAMLAQINRLSADPTLFFFDNETPKARYGHLWWVNYSLDFPAWHDYDQDFDRWMLHQSRDDSDEPMPYERRPYREIVAMQRAKGSLANWAHPTSWWRGGARQFITNIASEMPAHLIADGFLDGLVVMGYQAFRPQYQNLWFTLLDKGYRVPGVAEMDVNLSDSKLWDKKRAYVTLIHGQQPPQSAAEIAQSWRTGRLISSSGAWVEIEVDDVTMGNVATTSSAHTHQIVLNFGGESTHYDVELIGHGGELLWKGESLASGTLQLKMRGLSKRGYLIARVFALREDGKTRELEISSVSNPVYLHPAGQGFEAPSTTEITLQFSSDSRWRGGEVRFETASGEICGRATIQGTKLRESVPAGGRISLLGTDGTRETHYLINANQELNKLQRYLYRGQFLRDYPTLQAGEVPPEVWRFNDFKTKMRALTLNF